MGEHIVLTAEDGHSLDAYRAASDGVAKAGLLVIQEIFGVNIHIRELCDAFAADGYLAIAPAMFDRKQRQVDLGYTAETVAAGRALKDDVGWDDPIADMQAGLVALREAVGPAGKIGVVGYCFGGTVAWLGACSGSFDAAVGYYGGFIHTFLDRNSTCPVQLHFGAEDQGIPQENVEQIRAAKPDADIYVYDDAGHGFICDHRASYHEGATKTSRSRTLLFFEEHLN